MLGIKVDTLYGYARSGKLRALKIGKLWRFATADIEEFTSSHRYLASPVGAKPMLLPEIFCEIARKFEQRIAVICGTSQRSYAEIDLLWVVSPTLCSKKELNRVTEWSWYLPIQWNS